MSKVDPTKLTHAAVDRKTTILLQAAREEVGGPGTGGHTGTVGDAPGDEYDEKEKAIEATEEPGLDALAGRFGGVGGTIVRARRRITLTRRRRSHRRGTDQSLSGEPLNTDLEFGSNADPDLQKREEERRELKGGVNVGDAIDRRSLAFSSASRSSNSNSRAPSHAGDMNAVDGPVPNGATPRMGEHPGMQMSSRDMFSPTSGLVSSPLGTPASELKRVGTTKSNSSVRFQ